MTSTPPDREHLEEILGERIRSMAPLAVVDGGSHSAVHELETDCNEYVLRLAQGRQGFYTAHLPDGVPGENWLSSRWSVETAINLGIPAPEIVYVDRARRYVIMQKMPGEQITDYDKWDGCPYDEADFGALLARLHGVTLDGYGPVDDFGATYFATWPAFLARVARRLLSACRRRASIDDALWQDLRRAWQPRLEELRGKRAALLHMESLGFANILYDPPSRRITGLLDYEDCIGGDPLFELVWMCYYYGARRGTLAGMGLRHLGSRWDDQVHYDYARFERGYGAWPEDDLAELLYWPFTYLGKLSWIHPQSERAEHHRRALRMICHCI